MQKSVPIYVKALRENDVDRVLIPDSNNPVASSVLAKEKTKLQTQIENIITSLNDYYLKTETYSKEEVNGLFEQLTGLGIEFKEVQTLPTTGENKYIYLVPKTGTTNDIYDEYIWINGKFEKIGSTAINLANYYTKTETDAKLATKGGLSSANTWTGTNNFTGNLTKNGANVATEGQIPKVDSTLSTTSTNAIQNKAVKTELDKKGGKSTANTWSANNNFTGGLQKNGVDVATVKDLENISGSGDVDENGYKKFYFVDKNFEVNYFGWNVTKFNEFIGLDADKVLPVGTFIIDNQFTVVKITGTQTNNGVKSYNWDFQNIANSDVIKFMPFVISPDANGKYQFSDVYREEPVGIFLMDKNCVVYEIKSRSEFDFLNGYTYTMTKYCEAIGGGEGGGEAPSTPIPLKNGDAYPEFIYFDTSRDITDILAGLTYNAQGISIIAQFDTSSILVSVDIAAYSMGSNYAGLGGYVLAVINPYLTAIDVLFVSSAVPTTALETYQCFYGWNQRLVYTGDLTSTLTLPTSLDFLYGEDINTNAKIKTAKGDYYKIIQCDSISSKDGINEYGTYGTSRFYKTALYCDEAILFCSDYSESYPKFSFSIEFKKCGIYKDANDFENILFNKTETYKNYYYDKNGEELKFGCRICYSENDLNYRIGCYTMPKDIALPNGGTEGQVLTKTVDGVQWADISSGVNTTSTLSLTNEEQPISNSFKIYSETSIANGNINILTPLTVGKKYVIRLVSSLTNMELTCDLNCVTKVDGVLSSVLFMTVGGNKIIVQIYTEGNTLKINASSLDGTDMTSTLFDSITEGIIYEV
jgi:hypothetical protein